MHKNTGHDCEEVSHCKLISISVSSSWDGACRIQDYDFDLERMTSFEGDTGAYLQYAHVRLCSVARRVAPTVVLRDTATIDTSLLTEPKAREMVYCLAMYPDIVRTAFKTLEPSTIVSFCFR